VVPFSLFSSHRIFGPVREFLSVSHKSLHFRLLICKTPPWLHNPRNPSIEPQYPSSRAWSTPASSTSASLPSKSSSAFSTYLEFAKKHTSQPSRKFTPSSPPSATEYSCRNNGNMAMPHCPSISISMAEGLRCSRHVVDHRFFNSPGTLLYKQLLTLLVSSLGPTTHSVRTSATRTNS
jgi:hypothetical protein